MNILKNHFETNQIKMFYVGRNYEKSSLLYKNGCLLSQTEINGNVLLVIDNNSSKAFLHTGEKFIDFVRVSLLRNNQCYLSRESDRLIYSVPPLGEYKEKAVVANRTKTLDWELFDLKSKQHTLNYESDAISIISNIYFLNNNNIELFENFNESGLSDKAIILGKTLELMNVDEFENIANYYFKNSDKLKSLAEISEHKLFTESVSNLLQINNNPYYLDESLDFIADSSFLKSITHSKWVQLNYYIRKNFKPKKKFCVVATAKNEGIYLLEWISYYKSLGADAIFIYSNGNEDGSDTLLKELHDVGVIHYIENRVNSGVSAQNKAYTHALTINKEILDYEWSLFIDLDEFIVFNFSMFSSITDFLNWHNRIGSHAIALNWILSIPELNNDWINKPITKRISKFNNNTNSHIKTFFKPHYFTTSLPHYPLSVDKQPIVYRAANGGLHIKSEKHKTPSLSDKPSNTHAAILHYFNRTLPEFIWKYSRNRGDHPNMLENDCFTDSVLPLLKTFTTAIESKEYIDSSSHLPNNINIDESINELIKNDKIRKAYLNVQCRTEQRYNRIYALFWQYLEGKIKTSNHSESIRVFLERFNNN